MKVNDNNKLSYQPNHFNVLKHWDTYISCCCCVPVFLMTFPPNLSGTYPWPRYGGPCVRPRAPKSYKCSILYKWKIIGFKCPIFKHFRVVRNISVIDLSFVNAKTVKADLVIFLWTVNSNLSCYLTSKRIGKIDGSM